MNFRLLADKAANGDEGALELLAASLEKTAAPANEEQTKEHLENWLSAVSQASTSLLEDGELDPGEVLPHAEFNLVLMTGEAREYSVGDLLRSAHRYGLFSRLGGQALLAIKYALHILNKGVPKDSQYPKLDEQNAIASLLNLLSHLKVDDRGGFTAEKDPVNDTLSSMSRQVLTKAKADYASDLEEIKQRALRASNAKAAVEALPEVESFNLRGKLMEEARKWSVGEASKETYTALQNDYAEIYREYLAKEHYPKLFLRALESSIKSSPVQESSDFLKFLGGYEWKISEDPKDIEAESDKFGAWAQEQLKNPTKFLNEVAQRDEQGDLDFSSSGFDFQIKDKLPAEFEPSLVSKALNLNWLAPIRDKEQDTSEGLVVDPYANRQKLLQKTVYSKQESPSDTIDAMEAETEFDSPVRTWKPLDLGEKSTLEGLSELETLEAEQDVILSSIEEKKDALKALRVSLSEANPEEIQDLQDLLVSTQQELRILEEQAEEKSEQAGALYNSLGLGVRSKEDQYLRQLGQLILRSGKLIRHAQAEAESQEEGFTDASGSWAKSGPGSMFTAPYIEEFFRYVSVFAKTQSKFDVKTFKAALDTWVKTQYQNLKEDVGTDREESLKSAKEALSSWRNISRRNQKAIQAVAGALESLSSSYLELVGDSEHPESVKGMQDDLRNIVLETARGEIEEELSRVDSLLAATPSAEELSAGVDKARSETLQNIEILERRAKVLTSIVKTNKAKMERALSSEGGSPVLDEALGGQSASALIANSIRQAVLSPKFLEYQEESLGSLEKGSKAYSDKLYGIRTLARFAADSSKPLSKLPATTLKELNRFTTWLGSDLQVEGVAELDKRFDLGEEAELYTRILQASAQLEALYRYKRLLDIRLSLLGDDAPEDLDTTRQMLAEAHTGLESALKSLDAASSSTSDPDAYKSHLQAYNKSLAQVLSLYHKVQGDVAFTRTVDRSAPAKKIKVAGLLELVASTSTKTVPFSDVPDADKYAETFLSKVTGASKVDASDVEAFLKDLPLSYGVEDLEVALGATDLVKSQSLDLTKLKDKLSGNLIRNVSRALKEAGIPVSSEFAEKAEALAGDALKVLDNLKDPVELEEVYRSTAVPAFLKGLKDLEGGKEAITRLREGTHIPEEFNNPGLTLIDKASGRYEAPGLREFQDLEAASIIRKALEEKYGEGPQAAYKALVKVLQAEGVKGTSIANQVQAQVDLEEQRAEEDPAHTHLFRRLNRMIDTPATAGSTKALSSDEFFQEALSLSSLVLPSGMELEGYANKYLAPSLTVEQARALAAKHGIVLSKTSADPDSVESFSELSEQIKKHSGSMSPRATAKAIREAMDTFETFDQEPSTLFSKGSIPSDLASELPKISRSLAEAGVLQGLSLLSQYQSYKEDLEKDEGLWKDLLPWVPALESLWKYLSQQDWAKSDPDDLSGLLAENLADHSIETLVPDPKIRSMFFLFNPYLTGLTSSVRASVGEPPQLTMEVDGEDLQFFSTGSQRGFASTLLQLWQIAPELYGGGYKELKEKYSGSGKAWAAEAYKDLLEDSLKRETLSKGTTPLERAIAWVQASKKPNRALIESLEQEGIVPDDILQAAEDADGEWLQEALGLSQDEYESLLETLEDQGPRPSKALSRVLCAAELTSREAAILRAYVRDSKPSQFKDDDLFTEAVESLGRQGTFGASIAASIANHVEKGRGKPSAQVLEHLKRITHSRELASDTSYVLESLAVSKAGDLSAVHSSLSRAGLNIKEVTSDSRSSANLSLGMEKVPDRVKVDDAISLIQGLARSSKLNRLDELLASVVKRERVRALRSITLRPRRSGMTPIESELDQDKLDPLKRATRDLVSVMKSLNRQTLRRDTLLELEIMTDMFKTLGVPEKETEAVTTGSRNAMTKIIAESLRKLKDIASKVEKGLDVEGVDASNLGAQINQMYAHLGKLMKARDMLSSYMAQLELQVLEEVSGIGSLRARIKTLQRYVERNARRKAETFDTEALEKLNRREEALTKQLMRYRNRLEMAVSAEFTKSHAEMFRNALASSILNGVTTAWHYWRHIFMAQHSFTIDTKEELREYSQKYVGAGMQDKQLQNAIAGLVQNILQWSRKLKSLKASARGRSLSQEESLRVSEARKRLDRLIEEKEKIFKKLWGAYTFRVILEGLATGTDKSFETLGEVSGWEQPASKIETEAEAETKDFIREGEATLASIDKDLSGIVEPATTREASGFLSRMLRGLFH